MTQEPPDPDPSGFRAAVRRQLRQGRRRAEATAAAGTPEERAEAVRQIAEYQRVESLYVVPPRRRRVANPMQDPRPAGGVIEFTPDQVVEIRAKYHASQRRFAAMIGINVKTLRNWEQGLRRPHGPARALLRIANANPKVVASVLLRHRYPWWLD